MPFRGPKSHFADMLKGIELIEQFILDMDFFAYQADAKTKSAIERQLQVITEAAYRLKPTDEVLCPGPNWKQIRGMGNILRHAYDYIDDEAVWNTIQDDLPSLKSAVSKVLYEKPFSIDAPPPPQNG